MKILKKIKAWFADPKWYFLLPIILIAIGSTVGGTLIVTQDRFAEYMVWGYVLLGVMGVTLAYSIYGIVRIYPKAKEVILKWAEGHPRVDALFSQYGFTTLVTTTGSLFITFAFAVYNGSIAIAIKSVWFGALAAYNIVIMLLRGGILFYHGKSRKAVANGQSEAQTHIKDAKLYRIYGILLFLLPVCLSFAILQMVRAGDSFVHTGITIFVYALYAFYKIITAIYSFVKERRNLSMTIAAIKNIKLADAFVSILALQTAMFREFGGLGGDFSTTTMNAVTGTIVCALTVAIGVYMIVRASIRLKRLKQEKETIDDEQSENNGTQNDA